MFDTNIQNGLDKHLEYNGKFKQALDIGSCEGLYTDILKRSFDEVITFDALYQSDYQVVLSSSEKKQTFYFLKEKNGLSTLSLSTVNRYKEKHGIDYTIEEKNVITKTLDSFNLSPDFIKLDAGGTPEDILLGATNTIKNYKPTIIVDEITNTSCSDILIPLGYKKYNFENPMVNDPVYVYEKS